EVLSLIFYIPFLPHALIPAFTPPPSPQPPLHCLFVHYMATERIYSLSLHDALPILRKFDLSLRSSRSSYFATFRHQLTILELRKDRKSGSVGMPSPISYAVSCLKKKKKAKKEINHDKEINKKESETHINTYTLRYRK